MEENLKIKQKITVDQISRADVEEMAGVEGAIVFTDQMTKAKSKREPTPPGIRLPTIEKPTGEPLKKKPLNLQELKNILTANPGLEGIVNKAVLLTGKSKEELIKNIAKNLPREGVESYLILPLVSEVIGRYLLEIQATADPIQQNVLQALIESSKIERLAFANPEIRMLVNTLKKEYLHEGLKTEEAEKKANHHSLQLIHRHLEDRMEKNLQTATPNEIQEAVCSILSAKIPNIDSTAASGLVIGLSSATQVTNAFFDQIEKISQVQATAKTDNRINILNNAIKESQDLLESAKTMMAQTPPPVSEGELKEIKGYLEQLAALIGTLSSFLLKMQILDAKKGQEISKEERYLIESNFKAGMESIQKQTEALQKQSVLNKFLEIFGPLVGAIMMLVGIALTPFTGGATLAIVISVSAALFITTTALTATGTLQKGFEKLGEAIEKSLEKQSENVPEWKKSLAKGFTFLSIILVTLAVTAGTRGAAPMNLTVRLLANMVSMQVIANVLSASNVMGHFAEAIGKGTNMDDKNIAIFTMILNIVAMVGLGVTGGWMSIKDMNFAKKIDALSPILQKVAWLQKAVPIMQGGVGMAQAVGSIVQGTMSVMIGNVQLEEKELEALIQLINFLQKILGDMSGDLRKDGESFNQLNEMLIDVLNNAVAGSRRSMNKILDKIRS